MKKYLIALSLVGLVSTSCYGEVEHRSPNSITNEQVMELLRTGNDETVTSIMGALAEALPAQIKGADTLPSINRIMHTTTNRRELSVN
ncbi:MAG: hypothetical protein ACLR8Y_05835 [Alistipes indistinctus]